MTVTGDYRSAGAEDLLLLARDLDAAADEVARTSRTVRAAAGSVCRDLGCVPGTLATTVFALRDRAYDLRVRAARLRCEAEPPPSGAVRFTIPPPEPERGDGWGHLALDVLGFVPVFGAVPDGVNAAWYAAEGDHVNAGLSAAALVPFIGDAAGATKFVGKSVDEVAAALRGSREGERVFTVADLFANEGRKATKKSVTHVIEEHVGKSVRDLVERAARDGHPASSFHDVAAAANAIDAAMRSEADKVLAVVSGAKIADDLVAVVPGLADMGVIVTTRGELVAPTHVRVALRSTKDGAVVVTAYLEAL